MHSGITGREGVIGRQDHLGGAAAELHRAGVTGGRVAVHIFGRDREAIGGPGRDRRGVSRHDKRGGGSARGRGRAAVRVRDIHSDRE